MSNDEPKTDILDDLDAFEKVFNGEQAETDPQVTPEQDENEPAAEDNEELNEETQDDSDDGELGADTPAPDADDADDDDDDDADDGQDDDDTPKKKPTAKERVQQAVARQREAERERDALLARIEALENKSTDEKKEDAAEAPTVKALEQDAPKSDATDENGEPLYPLGDIDPKYIRDLTKWSAKQANAEVQAEQAKQERQRQVEQQQAQLVKDWETKLAASSEDLPNVREKGAVLEDTFRSIDPKHGQFLAGTIMTLEYGPHAIDYLADNPQEAQDIVNSGPMEAAIKLGSLNERLARQYAKSNTPKKKVSKAPKPAPTNKGNSRPKTIAPDTDNLDDFEKLFNQV